MSEFKTKENTEVLVFMASIFCMSLILFFVNYSKWDTPVKILNFFGELTIIPTILLTLFLLGFSIYKLIRQKTFNFFLLISLGLNMMTAIVMFAAK